VKVLDNYLQLHDNALAVRNQRLEVIAQNIANASTPNYKARDVDFAKVMRELQSGNGTAQTTHSQHISSDAGRGGLGDLVYRVPLSPSLDNNTVEISVEQASYGKAAAQYQASLQFLESRISGLRKALRGD
jgi:flagellar basal-body rod protein FlgB